MLEPMSIEQILSQQEKLKQITASHELLTSELARAKENYQIIKQILEDSLKVKMSYQSIIEKALSTQQISKEVKLIIKSQKSGELKPSIDKEGEGIKLQKAIQ